MEVVLKRFPFRRIGFRFDAMAVMQMCQQYGIELHQTDKIPKNENVPSWVWNAHKSYCMQKYKKPKFTYEGMKKFIALMPKQEWDLILEAMLQSRGPEGDEAEKKK